MPRIHVILKQNTPIMHFQHDQQGATVRGTELKPRLDAFLIHHAFGNNPARYERFIVGHGAQESQKKDNAEKKKQAFDYRVKILPGRSKKTVLYNTDGTPYFTMGGSGKHKAVISAEEEQIVELQILSRHAELISIIKAWLCPFFMTINFGFRKSKGFGSYTVKQIDDHVYSSVDYGTWLKQATNRQREFENTVFCFYAVADNWQEIMKQVKQKYSDIKRVAVKEKRLPEKSFIKVMLLKPVCIDESEKAWCVFILLKKDRSDWNSSVLNLMKTRISGDTNKFQVQQVKWEGA